MRIRRKSPIWQYALAAGCIALAVVARRLLDPAIGDKFPFPTVFLAILVPAWFGGFGPALFAVVLSCAASDYFLIPPRGQFGGKAVDQQIGVALNLVTGVGIAALGGAMHFARRRAERRREGERLHRERLNVTLESIGDGVIATDAAGAVTFLNPVARHLTGWTEEEAVGQPLGAVFHIVNESTREPVENPALRALQEGVIVGLANHTVLIARDGVERPIDDSAAPIRSGGSIAGSVLVFRDISQRKREEGARAERLRLISLRADASAALAANLPVAEALKRVCGSLVRELEVAFARIWTLDEGAEILVLRASEGLYTHLDGPHSRVPVGKYKIGRIAQSRQPHLTNAVPDDPNVGDREWAKREGMIAFAGYPLIVEGRVVGVLAMFARRPLTEGILADLLPLADGIGQFIDRKLAEERFARQAERARVTLDSIGDGVLSTDAAGRVTFANAVAAALTGWTPELAQGAAVEAVYRVVDAETGDRIENPVARVLRTASAVGPEERAVLIARDGTRRDVEAGASPIRDGGELLAGAVLVFRDATEKRRRERELADRENQFGTLAESIPQLAWMAEPDGHIFWYNRRWYEYTGTTFESMQGWGWQSVHDPAVLPMVMERWQNALARGEPFEMVFPLRSSAGEFRQFLTRVIPVKDGLGRVTRWFGSNTDIQEQQAAADELRRLAAELSVADRRKDEFLATLAHELRNPLAPIRTGLQILEMAGASPATVEETRAMMVRQFGHMVRLVDDLLDIGRLTHDKLELRSERVDLAEVLKGAVDASRPLVEAGGHELAVALPPAPVAVFADPTRLVQVFSNLINNAAKYTGRGGRIRVEAARRDGGVRVSVADTGIGIAPNHLPRIFEMFSQVESALQRSQGGLGIGLTLVKRLVEMHGGRVEAHSAGLGQGSEFAVILPVLAEGIPSEPPREKPPPTAKAPLRILVVDDNRDGADSLALMLTLRGHETRTAYDGPEAVAAAEEYNPEVILLDIGLPKLNGYEACRRIRAQPRGQAIVVIACTGWGQSDDVQRAKDAGFDRHMVKPVDPAALEELLRDWS